MKTKLILILISTFISSTLFCQVQFSHTNISNAKSQAASSGLPYFVYISADWCLPCQIMEETTFKSLDLQNKIDQKYTAYKVDFHSEAGAEWIATHELCCLPTFLFFDEYGNKTQQIQSSLTASGFIQVLDSPQSYSKQDKAFADANTPKRLKSQVSMQSDIDESLAITTNVSSDLHQTSSNNFSASIEDNSVFNNLSTSSHSSILVDNEIISTSSAEIEISGIENKLDFLNDLRKHIKSLEVVYTKYESEEVNKSRNISPLAKMEGFSSNSDTKSEYDNAEELAQTIKELKVWETQLGELTNNTQATVKNLVISTNEDTVSPTFITTAIEVRTYYSVQMGMFKTEAYARRMVEDLAKNYTYSIEMKTIEKSGDTMHRVLLGPFMEESEAKEVFSKMRKDGRKAVVGVF